MSTFGNFALNLIGSAITEGITGNNTGYYQLGGYNNSVFTCGNNCNSAASEAARINNRADLKAGLIFGGVLAGVLGVSKLIQNSSHIEDVKVSIQAETENLNTELAKLGDGTTVDNYKEKINSNKEIINSFTTAETNHKNKTTELGTVDAKLTTLQSSYDGYTQSIAAAEVILSNPEASDNDKIKAQATKDSALKKQGEIQVEIDQAKQQKTKLEQEIATLAETLKTVGDQIKAMEIPSIEGLDIQAKIIENIILCIDEHKKDLLNGADKSQINRTSDKNFAKLFDSEGNVTEEKVSKRDIRAAIAQFRAASGDDQKVAASKLQKLWECF